MIFLLSRQPTVRICKLYSRVIIHLFLNNDSVIKSINQILKLLQSCFQHTIQPILVTELRCILSFSTAARVVFSLSGLMTK